MKILQFAKKLLNSLLNRGNQPTLVDDGCFHYEDGTSKRSIDLYELIQKALSHPDDFKRMYDYRDNLVLRNELYKIWNMTKQKPPLFEGVSQKCLSLEGEVVAHLRKILGIPEYQDGRGKPHAYLVMLLFVFLSKLKTIQSDYHFLLSSPARQANSQPLPTDGQS